MTDGTADAFSLFDVEKNNVILESVKLAEDGSGDLILRLYESKKAAVHTALFTTLPVAQAWSCTMLEEKETELVVEDKSISLDFRAFEIKTVLAFFASEDCIRRPYCQAGFLFCISGKCKETDLIHFLFVLFQPCLYFFRVMYLQIIKNEEHLLYAVMYKSSHKINQFIGIHIILVQHKSQLASLGNS